MARVEHPLAHQASHRAAQAGDAMSGAERNKPPRSSGGHGFDEDSFDIDIDVDDDKGEGAPEAPQGPPGEQNPEALADLQRAFLGGRGTDVRSGTLPPPPSRQSSTARYRPMAPAPPPPKHRRSMPIQYEPNAGAQPPEGDDGMPPAHMQEDLTAIFASGDPTAYGVEITDEEIPEVAMQDDFDLWGDDDELSDEPPAPHRGDVISQEVIGTVQMPALGDVDSGLAELAALGFGQNPQESSFDEIEDGYEAVSIDIAPEVPLHELYDEPQEAPRRGGLASRIDAALDDDPGDDLLFGQEDDEEEAPDYEPREPSIGGAFEDEVGMRALDSNFFVDPDMTPVSQVLPPRENPAALSMASRSGVAQGGMLDSIQNFIEEELDEVELEDDGFDEALGELDVELPPWARVAQGEEPLPDEVDLEEPLSPSSAPTPMPQDDGYGALADEFDDFEDFVSMDEGSEMEAHAPSRAPSEDVLDLTSVPTPQLDEATAAALSADMELPSEPERLLHRRRTVEGPPVPSSTRPGVPSAPSIPARPAARAPDDERKRTFPLERPAAGMGGADEPPSGDSVGGHPGAWTAPRKSLTRRAVGPRVSDAVSAEQTPPAPAADAGQGEAPRAFGIIRKDSARGRSSSAIPARRQTMERTPALLDTFDPENLSDDPILLLRQARALRRARRFEDAQLVLDELLKLIPDDPEVRQLTALNRGTLEDQYLTSLGNLDRAPSLAIRPHELMALGLDSRGGYIVSQIDGVSTFRDLIELSPMSRFNTLRLLKELVEFRVIRVPGNSGPAGRRTRRPPQK